MRINDKYMTIATGVLLFLGVGGFMHFGQEIFKPEEHSTQIAKADIRTEIKTDAEPLVLDVAYTSAQPIIKQSPAPAKAIKIKPNQLNCDLNIQAKSLKGARIKLQLTAPCHINQVATISHAGLRFNEMVNAGGTIELIIPVLSEPAQIEVSFADGARKSITTSTKGLTLIKRSGIAHSNQIDLNITVAENLYNPNRKTYSTQQTAHTYKAAQKQQGGYITTLGNASIIGGVVAHIYSLENMHDILVDFQVAIDVSENICGQNFTLKSFSLEDSLGIQITNRNISITDCSANNKNMVLKNILQTMMVAQRN